MGRGSLLNWNIQNPILRNLLCSYLVGVMHFWPFQLVGLFQQWFWFWHSWYGYACLTRPKPMLKHYFSISFPVSFLSWLLAVVGSRVLVSPYHIWGLVLEHFQNGVLRGVGLSPLGALHAVGCTSTAFWGNRTTKYMLVIRIVVWHLTLRIYKFVQI